MRHTAFAGLGGLTAGVIITAAFLAPPLGGVPGGANVVPVARAAPVAGAQVTAVDEDGSPAPAGPREAIRVHGHWTITVHEPDGRLVSQSEFENILTGPGLLANVLARNSSVGRWQIFLSNVPSQPCLAPGPPASPFGCRLVESGSAIPSQPTYFKTLTVNVGSGADANKLILHGTATAERDGGIGRVLTSFHQCSSSTAPANPCESTPEELTDHSLTSVVSVSTGQQIDVTVKISFS